MTNDFWDNIIRIFFGIYVLNKPIVYPTKVFYSPRNNIIMETLHINILCALTTGNVLPMWLNIILKLVRKAKNEEVGVGYI